MNYITFSCLTFFLKNVLIPPIHILLNYSNILQQNSVTNIVHILYKVFIKSTCKEPVSSYPCHYITTSATNLIIEILKKILIMIFNSLFFFLILVSFCRVYSIFFLHKQWHIQDQSEHLKSSFFAKTIFEKRR